jgi:hypothetical protein
VLPGFFFAIFSFIFPFLSGEKMTFPMFCPQIQTYNFFAKHLYSILTNECEYIIIKACKPVHILVNMHNQNKKGEKQ